MSKRNFLLKIGLVGLAAFMLMGLPTLMYAATNDTWQPTRPAAGMGSAVWVNYNGGGGALIIDLQKGTFVRQEDNHQTTNNFVVTSDNQFTVPPAANDMPGRMQMNLDPGSYRYTASVPGIGTVNGTLEVTAGQITGLSFYGTDPKTVVENHHSHGNNNDHSTSTIVFTKLAVAPEDLTSQAR